MRKKKGDKGVTGNLDTDINRAEKRSFTQSSSSKGDIRKMIKSNPFINMGGLINEEVIDSFLNAGQESIKVTQAVIPNMVTDYVRNSGRKAMHHAIEANKQILSGVSKMLDNAKDLADKAYDQI